MKKVIYTLTPIFIITAFSLLGFYASVSAGGNAAVSVVYVAIWGIYLAVMIRERFIPAMVITAVYFWTVCEIALSVAAIGKEFAESFVYRYMAGFAAGALLPFIAAYPADSRSLAPAYIAAAVAVVFALVGCIAAGMCSGSGIFSSFLVIIPAGALTAGVLFNAGRFAEALIARSDGTAAPEAEPSGTVVTVIYLLAWLITAAAAIYRSDRSPSGLAIGSMVFWGITGIVSLGLILIPERVYSFAIFLLSPLYGLSTGAAGAGFGAVCLAASFVMCALSAAAWLLFFGKKDGRISRIRRG